MNKQVRVMLQLALAIIILVSVNGCSKKKTSHKKQVDKAFTTYIKAYPSGLISSSADIVIELVNDVPLNIQTEVETQKLFSFSPSVKGKLFWRNNNTIVFSPDEHLDPNMEYTVKFKLGKVLNVPDNLKTFEFGFRTLKQVMNIEFNGLRAYNITDLKLQQLKGRITTSDVADQNLVEQLLEAEQNGKNLTVSWEHNGNEHLFTIENIARTEQKGEVEVEWNGKKIGSEDKGEQTIEIPALGDFKVFDVNVEQQPEQCITIWFTDPIDQTQEMDGLVYLETGLAVKLVTGESSIKLYPTERLNSLVSLVVETGIKNIMGYKLSQPFSKQIEFLSLNPAIEFMGNGVIMPQSEGLVVPFKAVNLSAVNVKIVKLFEDNIGQFLQNNQLDGSYELKRVGRIVYKQAMPLISEKVSDYGRWNTFALDISKLVETEPGAIYRIHLSFDKSQSLYPCNNDAPVANLNIDTYNPNARDTEAEQYDKPEGYYYYDDYYEYDEYTDYDWRERDNPCSNSYFQNSDHFVSRNILASNLGIIVKGDNKNQLIVAVTNLLTTKSESGTEIEIYNYQNRLMQKTVTNSDGMANVNLDSKPFLLIAKKDKQRGYLRLDDGTALSVSMFDVGGATTEKGLKGFIYTERGVWRPGDSIFATFILEDKQSPLPPNHPVVFELYNPNNQLVQRKVKSDNLNGFYTFTTVTNPNDPTGNWLAKVLVGGNVYTKTLKIEMVKPNRLKINLDFGTEILSHNVTPKADLAVKWLHGAIASNLKTDVELALGHSKTEFKGYENYTFDNPVKTFESDDKTVFSGTVNENGQATFTVPIEITENAPGMLKAKFKTRVFEKGGDFSTDLLSVNYSPYNTYVGFNLPDGKGWNGAIYSNEPNMVAIATLDENGNTVTRKKLKIEVYSIEWRWWWEHSEDDDLARYVSNAGQNLMLTDYVDTKDGKALYELNLRTESWGRKLMIITDPESGHSAGKLFYTTYKGWWSKPGSDNPGGAEMLTFSTDKKVYTTNEKVSVELPVQNACRAFISLENGSSVIKTFWVDADAQNNTFTFETSPEMAPNVYVHVTLIQPHNQTVNDMPIRLYGVQNIGVEDPKTHLNPVLTMPDVLEPEKEVTINVSEANNQSMTYTIAVVDEGLLDLTRFKTPNAWETFYAREALGVKTWDMYKFVIGAFNGEFAGLLAIGGDEDMKANEDKNANRFKPVVKFMGPFELKSGTNTHTFIMPNYIGSVKTMLIAGQNGAYGKTEKTTPVKKPLMVLATLPRVLSPGDEVVLPVTLFAMESGIKNVSLSVETNNLLTIVDEAKKQASFIREGDQTLNFKLKTNELTGIAKVKVVATSGKHKATYELELDVRLPNPAVTKTISATVQAGKQWENDVEPFGLSGTNQATVEVSSIPPLNLSQRLEYLMQYPHGCIEQTTSAVFPQLYLSKLMDLTNAEKAEIEKNIRSGIQRISTFQLSNGGLSYWPGESGFASDWGTSYAGHFMIEAQKSGYLLPHGFQKNWVNYQTQQANNWSESANGTTNRQSQSAQLMQAYRLYTLALAEKPAMGAMNRLRESKHLTVQATWTLASAYFLAGRQTIAEEMVKNLTMSIEPYSELSYTYGNKTRDEAMVLQTLTLLNRHTDAINVVKSLSNELSSDKWLSTQATAFGLLAIAKFSAVTGADQNIDFELKFTGSETIKINTKQAVSTTSLNVANAKGGKASLLNKSDKVLFVTLTLTGVPLVGTNVANASNLYVKTRYLNTDLTPLDPSSIKQGTDFVAEVRIEHPGILSDYKEMALTQLFPAGWEIRNLRFEESASKLSGDAPRYQDIRDDRVYTYFDLDQHTSKTFRILLNASYAGKFYLPVVSCEAMYDNTISSNTIGQWVEVVQAP